MLAIVLALAAAAGFGGSDFAAGLAARGASVIRVTIVAEVTAAALGLLIVPWLGAPPPSPASTAWAAAAGVSGVCGAMALYLGFRHAAFSVASSLSAVGSAALSVLAGLLFGERPGTVVLAGIALALPAIAAVSASQARHARQAGDVRPGQNAQHRQTGEVRPGHDVQDGPESGGAPAPRAEAAVAGANGAGGAEIPQAYSRDGRAATGRHLAGVGYGLLAGAGFAMYFIGLSRAGPGSGLWPVLVAQLAALAGAVAAGAVTRQLRPPAARALPLAAATGIGGVAGTACFFAATHAGLLAVTAVITSLYPAVTIVFARLMLGERLTPVRLAGLCLAAGSVALIAAGGAG
jgi:drug/metabolite transporter (DMT)-like permease